MDEILRLRPHHLLCLRFFAGHGYDEDFIENLRLIQARMREERPLSVMLVRGCDDICDPCPHRVGHRCRYAGSVSAKDASVAEALGIACEGEMPADQLNTLVERAVEGLSDVRHICGDCEWSSICNRQLRPCKSRSP
jgi:hypothetical protein